MKEANRKRDHNSEPRDLKAATALWKPVGTFGFLASIGVWAGMASESIAPDTLKWSSLDSYAVALFAVPLLSGTLIAQCIIGGVYAKASGPSRDFVSRVPDLLQELEGSSLRNPVAIICLLAFVILPSFVLAHATVKFLQGSYYYAADAAKGCDPKGDSRCEDMGNYWNHFKPKHSIHLRDLTDTPYRYQGNKTYIPILFPFLLLGLTASTLVFLGRYLLILFARETAIHT
jgi:hypothetical protein